MSVYVDKLPESCADCPCNNDYYTCGVLGEPFSVVCEEEVDWCEERMGCCPLIELVHCKDCKHLYNDADCGKACEYTEMGMKPDDFCSYGEKDV